MLAKYYNLGFRHFVSEKTRCLQPIHARHTYVGNLDSEIVLGMLRHSNRELGQTVLMITHNPEAASYGDRIIHMRDGEIVAPEKDPQWTGHS